MPKRLPPSLAEVPPEEPHQPQETSAETQELPTAAPDDVLRVLGGIGLPGDIEVARFDQEAPPEEEPVDPVVFVEPAPVVDIKYGVREGLDTAKKQKRIYGNERALDVLSKTERTPETDALHDQILLEEAEKQKRVYGSDAGLGYLDQRGFRTNAAQAKANGLYDKIIIEEAKKQKRVYGSGAGLDFIDSHLPRTSATKPTLDKLYDDTILEEAQKQRRVYGKDAALDYLDRHTPRTTVGVQGIEKLRQQIRDSR